MAHNAQSSEPIPLENRDVIEQKVLIELLPTERRLGIVGHYFKLFMASYRSANSTHLTALLYKALLKSRYTHLLAPACFITASSDRLVIHNKVLIKTKI